MKVKKYIDNFLIVVVLFAQQAAKILFPISANNLATQRDATKKTCPVSLQKWPPRAPNIRSLRQVESLNRSVQTRLPS